jgi:ribosome-binding protein aMBF1 (putative translation factor)
MNTRQDWEPVVLRKYTRSVSAPNLPARQVGTDPSDIKIKTVSRDLATCITQSRITQNLSQSDLAKRCNVLPSVIQDIERKGLYTPEVINKVLKVLNVSFTGKRFAN